MCDAACARYKRNNVNAATQLRCRACNCGDARMQLQPEEEVQRRKCDNTDASERDLVSNGANAISREKVQLQRRLDNKSATIEAR